MRRLKLLYIILIFLGLSACKKDPEIPKPTREVFLKQEIKDWTYFKPGSYWIIRDSVTLKEDSIYVTSISSAWKKRYSADTIFLHEEITIKFSATYYYYSDYVISRNAIRLDHKHNSGLILFNLDTAAIVTKEGDGILEHHSISNYNQAGIDYENVRSLYYYYIYSGPSSPQGHLMDRVYWKKNVGLIKKVYFPGHNFSNTKELIRYKVVQ